MAAGFAVGVVEGEPVHYGHAQQLEDAGVDPPGERLVWRLVLWLPRLAGAVVWCGGGQTTVGFWASHGTVAVPDRGPILLRRWGDDGEAVAQVLCWAGV